MRPNDIENWALSIIERVESKQPVEDSRVELKSEWPKDHNKAARQIAGHANAARGEPVLWLLGVDEKRGVTGADYQEVSNWMHSVEAKFDGLSPPSTHLNIPYRGGTVVAILWETERRPFLVKNSQGGPVSLEVPWRDAGSTRTANRTDLLKMLYPVSKIPSFEVIEGHLNISTGDKDDFGQLLCKGELLLNVYILPGNDNRVVVPYHKCKARLRFTESDLYFDFTCIWCETSTFGTLLAGIKPSSTITCTNSELIIDGPGMATFKTNNPAISSKQKPLAYGNVEIEIKVRPVGVETAIPILCNLDQTDTPDGALGRWVI